MLLTNGTLSDFFSAEGIVITVIFASCVVPERWLVLVTVAAADDVWSGGNGVLKLCEK